METDWTTACAELAQELLADLHVMKPPVDALSLAEKLSITVAWDESQAGRARLHQLAGQPTIFLKPGDRPERFQWAAAHEIGEAIAWRICERLRLAPEDLRPTDREDLANLFASRLLLPEPWFQTAMAQSQGDLTHLKNQFATASHELIAGRMLDLESPRIMTICDNGQLTRRRCNFGVRAPLMTNSEQRLFHAAHQSGGIQTSDETIVWPRVGRGTVTVWPLHEPEWKREIAIATVDLFVDEMSDE